LGCNSGVPKEPFRPIDGVQVTHGKGNFLGEGRPVVKYRDSVVSCAKTAEPIKMPFGLWTWVAPRKHVLNWEGAIFRERICPDMRGDTAIGCAKWLNRSTYVS